MKQVEKLNQQLHDVKVQLNEVKNQLAEAAEFKVISYFILMFIVHEFEEINFLKFR